MFFFVSSCACTCFYICSNMMIRGVFRHVKWGPGCTFQVYIFKSVQILPHFSHSILVYNFIHFQGGPRRKGPLNTPPMMMIMMIKSIYISHEQTMNGEPCTLVDYLKSMLTPVSAVSTRRHLRSAGQGDLIVPRTMQNSWLRSTKLEASLQLLVHGIICRRRCRRHHSLTPAVLSSFLRQSCLLFTNVTSALDVFLNVMRYINPRFTYLLTYPDSSQAS